MSECVYKFSFYYFFFNLFFIHILIIFYSINYSHYLIVFIYHQLPLLFNLDQFINSFIFFITPTDIYTH